MRIATPARSVRAKISRLPDNPVAFVEPMLASLSEMPADVANYAFEWKWDGVRAMYGVSHLKRRATPGLMLWSRNGIEITWRYPELHPLAQSLDCRSILMDGEIVALDDAGRSSFRLLQQRMHVDDPPPELVRAVPAFFIPFDILMLNGNWLVDEPFEERRDVLESQVTKGPHWRLTPSQVGVGPSMLEAARSAGYEGLVAKRLDSIYEPGRRSPAWRKIKVIQRQEFVLGGWIPEGKTNASRVGSMLLGYYDADGALRYAGRVGTGLNASDHGMLVPLFNKHRQASSPFADAVPGGSVQFLKPRIVIDVEFRRWPDQALVQQGAFKGVRFDKDPRQVVKERPVGFEESN